MLIAMLLALGVPGGPTRADFEGRALPPGAVARFGSSALRHSQSIRRLAYSADGQHLAAADRHGLTYWNLHTGRAQWRAEFLEEFSPGTIELAITASGDEVRILWLSQIGEGKTVRQRLDCRRYATTTGEQLPSVKIAEGRVTRGILTPDAAVVFAFEDTKILRADARTGARQFTVAGRAYCNRVACNPAGTVLAVNFGAEQYDVNNILILNGETGDPWRRTTFPSETSHLAVAPGGTVVACGLNDSGNWDSRVLAYDPKLGRELWSELAPWLTDRPLGGWTFIDGGRPAFSPDGSWFALATNRGVLHRIQTRTGFGLGDAIAMPSGTSASVAVAPDGRTIAAAEFGIALHSQTGRTAALLNHSYYSGLRFDAAGATLTAGAAPGDDTITWRVADGRELARQHYDDALRSGLHSFPLPDGFILDYYACVSPDGSRRLEWNNSARIPAIPRRLGLCLVDSAIDWPMAQLWNSNLYASAIRFSDDSRYVAVASPYAGVEIRDAGSAQLLAQLPDPVVPGRYAATHNPRLAFAPDGRLAFTSRGDPKSSRSLIRLWIPGQNETRTLAAIEDGVGDLAWLDPNRIAVIVGHRTSSAPPIGIAVIDADERACVVEMASGRVRARLPAGDIVEAAFSPDGRLLATTSSRETAILWDVRGLDRLELILTLDEAWERLAGDDAALAFVAMRTFAAAGGRGRLFLQEKTRPAAAADPAAVKKLILQLDAPAYRDREAAVRELVRLGEPVYESLRQTVQATSSAEVKVRAQSALRQIRPDRPTPAMLRNARAVEVLAWADPPSPRRLAEK
jgi:WD40 repeat protein